MNDLTGNVYSASIGSMQAPQIDPGRFGKFEFSRAMALGMDGWKKYVGLGIGTTIVGGILFFVAYLGSILLVGLFFLPHIMIGPMLLGYHMVKGTAEFSTLFRGFQAYGRVLGAFFILLLMFLPIVVLMMAPIMATSVWSAMQKTEGTDGLAPAQAVSIAFMYLMIFALMPVIYYLMGRLCLVFPLIVERGYRSWDAIKTSWAVTKEYQWWLMLMTFVTQLMGQIGIYLCGVGIFITFPLAQAFMGGAIVMLLGEDDGRNLSTAGTAPAPVTISSGPAPVTPPSSMPAPSPEQPKNPYT